MRTLTLLTLVALLAFSSAWTAAARAQTPAGTAVAQRAQALVEEGRHALRGGDRFTALRLFGLARELQPDDGHIRRAVADVLAELGAYEGATRALGPAADLGIRSRRAAQHLRWAASVDPPEAGQRHVATDAAIREFHGLLAEARQAQPVDAGLVARLERDLVAALAQRERWPQVLAEVERLRAQGGAIPPYVRRAEADALLASRRPAEARAAYEEVLRVDPGDQGARMGLFWSALDEEDHATAFAIADGMAARGGPTRPFSRMASPQADHEWLDAQVLAAQARRFADLPAQAWDRVEALALAAPASPALREELGEAAAARGWPRRAHEEILIARSLVLDDPGLELALAEAELRRRQWSAAEERAARVAQSDPGNARLRRLQRDLDAWRMAELQLEVAPRQEKGDAALAPGDGLGARARVYTAPLREHWRLLAEANRETSRPREDRLVRNRYGVGVEGRFADVTLELAGWSNTGLDDHPGATASVQWQPDDHWTWGAQLEAFSPATPLLALQAGIRSDRAVLSAVHAWNESRVASASLQASDFTDGNRRFALGADYGAIVFDSPRTDVVLRPSIYASRNTRSDAPYFNPRRDAALNLAVEVQDRLWRRFERSWDQRLALALGPYWQDGFGTRWTASASYEQGYRIDPRTAWRWGVALARRYYDGDAEDALVLFARLQQRF